jgi:hypothetical protein
MYAALAWVISGMVMALIPDRQEFGLFQPVNALIGLLVGWFIVGSRLGVDYVTAMGIGFTGMATTVFWCLFAQSLNEMLRLALARRYDGALEATIALFKIAIDYAGHLVNGPVLIAATLGGMIAGVIAEYVHRRWS